MRTIDWVDEAIELVDQTRLPNDVVTLRLTTVAGLVGAIERLAVRGAPAIGVAGAFGVVLAVRQCADLDAEALGRAVASIRSARPTAVNLAAMVDRVASRIPDGVEAVLGEALAVRDSELAASVAMGDRGADLVQSLVATRPVRVMTICNTGGLATVERGTALAVAFTLADLDVLGEVIALETRPLLQGARLTTWELDRAGIRYRLAVDAAAASLLARGCADVVLVGADRIAVNGDTANKIGTFALALAAAHAGVPFVVVAPESTVDPGTPDGDAIEIEDRGSDEVTSFAGHPTAPPASVAVNPAFDVTPASLITAIVTDRRVIRCDQGETPGSGAVQPP